MYLHPIKDGVNHININLHKSKTVLGSQLSNLAHTPFTLNQRRYASVEALWYILSLPPTVPYKYIRNLRGLHGITAKEEGKRLQITYGKVLHENFEKVILRAFSEKLKCNPDLEILLKNSKLPIAHYLWYGKIAAPSIRHLPQYQWMNDFWMKTRENLEIICQ